MKALEGKLAKIIKADVQGREQLRQYITTGKPEIIVLSNGDSYRISHKL